MSHPARREYAALAAISGSGGMSLLIPLYLSYLGYPVGVVGLVTGLGALATLLSRLPVPMVYRPERSRELLLIAAGGGMLSSAVLPLLPDLTSFTAALFVNRALVGVATTVYLARYLDMLGEGTDRRRAMGNYGGTQAAGFATSGVLVGVLADYLGYPAGFLGGAAMSALGGLLLIGAPNPRPIPAAHAAGLRPRPRGGLRRHLAALDDPGLWRVLNATAWNNFFFIVQASFFPVLATAVGLGPAQVGLIRGGYAAVNATARPTAGVVMGRFSLRQVTYLGLVVQAAPLCAFPVVRDFPLFLVLSLVAAFGRAVVVVAASAGLAEEVDETRVSRGVATSAFSTSSDVPNVVGPPAAGFVASVVGVGPMFPITAVGMMACFALADLVLSRWQARRALESARVTGTR
jgi:MFS family permease